MNLFLQNSFMLPLLALVGIPILVHLFARTRPPVYQFSSVVFIQRIVRKTLRIKRPQDILMLILRTLLALALCLLFLRPMLMLSSRKPGAFEQRHVVVVVDATASMAYADGAQTRFAMACGAASEILSGLSSRDTADIVWLKAQPTAVFSDMSVNFAYLQDALRRATVTMEAGDVSEAIHQAAELLRTQEGRREICVVSDFQVSEWRDGHVTVPNGLDLVQVRIGEADPDNAALSAIRTVPVQPLLGEEALLLCDVYNFSPQPIRRTVYVNVEASRETQALLIPAFGKATAAFRHRFVHAGETPVEATLDGDSFSGDDHYWTLCSVRDGLLAGVVSNDAPTVALWNRALSSLGWIRSSPVALGDGAMSADAIPDVLMIAGWDGRGSEAIRAALAAGRTVVCMPQSGLDVAAFAGLVGATTAGTNGVFQWSSGGAPKRIRIMTSEDPLFAVFSQGGGDPARALFQGRLMFTPPGKPEWLLSYEDGVPALLRYRGDAGQLYLWNMALSPSDSTLARQPELVPLLGELILRSRDSREGYLDTGHVPGHTLSLDLAVDGTAADIVLKAANNTVIPVHESRGDRQFQMVSEPIAQPGLYRWEGHGRQLASAPVNFPASESDLRAMTDPKLTPDALAVSTGTRVQRLRDGLPLWPYLCGIVIVLALLEGLLLLMFERKGPWKIQHN